jgi:glucose-1-phosphate cytidylyltransferase
MAYPEDLFANYFLHMSNVTFDMANNKMEVHQHNAEPWKITLVDTGEKTLTGGRLKRVREYIKDEKEFFFTYGDGVSDVDITALAAFHRKHGKLVTVTAVQPPGRYGSLDMAPDGQVRGFVEKPKGDGGWINGGFFVLSPKVLEYVDNDVTSWESEPLERLAAARAVMAYEHSGFWQPMDTLRDKNNLESLWEKGKAPWKIW